ncbi:hypothetical protein SNOG_02209 [Parastagonospora nodorum SN15]|uniref:Uncharacterized protein n=1 Tax=Phaeosphaeria nodorum (strain SN15 / ATCC MYA-4574 / FGSC 10173) TaxID=321614 RepID=Q0V1A5_PHANO|nr:hypothetical protein SNOG_02209 [Parastagonospora nodorum SN15]EAT90421.1 hypothetical protein SNOG_02209 [Parastagonospora nodorum SN15]
MSEAQGEFPSQPTSVYTSVIVDPAAVHESDLWNAGLAQPASGSEAELQVEENYENPPNGCVPLVSSNRVLSISANHSLRSSAEQLSDGHTQRTRG